jgi:hypothetical protein
LLNRGADLGSFDEAKGKDVLGPSGEPPAAFRYNW